MLESLIRYEEIQQKPWLMFFWAILITSVGIMFSLQIYYEIQVSGTTINLTGLFSVLFTIIPSVYFITMLIKKEEMRDEEELSRHYEKGFLRRHERDMIIFLSFFMGITFTFAVWAFMLPPNTFQMQVMKIQEIRGLAGSMTLTGQITADELGRFWIVFENNLQVTGFAFIFSILFGAGAVFIIVWNASILGVYIGRLSESLMHIPTVSLNFLPHGIPEIAGYLMAGVAGSVISASIIRGRKKELVMKVCLDSMKLLLIAFAFILVAAVIETMSLLYKMAGLIVFYTAFIFMVTNCMSRYDFTRLKRR